MDAHWLRRLGEAGLATLLTRRPELTRPAPTSLSAVASGLQQPGAVLSALRRLNGPTLQVAEALAALGETTRDALSALLGSPAQDDLDRPLRVLTEHGLLLADGEGGLELVRSAQTAWANPLGLGGSASLSLAMLTVDEMKSICSRLGVPPPTSGRAAVERTLLAALRDSARIRSIAEKAPPETAGILTRVAATGEHVQYSGFMYGRQETPAGWAVARGLLLRTAEWSGEFEMPAEVGLALRGPEYLAPFDPVPPQCPRATVDPALVARSAASASAAMLRVATSILDEASRSKVATVRNGGVGVRELKRLAKANGAKVEEVRLALALAHGAGLISTMSTDAVTPIKRYDEWLDLQPSDRFAELVRAWWALPYSPLETVDQAWVPREEHDGTSWLRETVLELAADSGALTDLGAFVGLAYWHRPSAVRRDMEGFTACVVSCLSEATMLGLSVKGMVTDAGRALLASDPTRLAHLLTGVGSVVRRAHLQADLTAVVTGTAAPALTEILDAAADRESGSTALTWRFSPASVRRALDAGRTADTVLADLASIAAAVPQTLEYLIRDVARQHGSIRVSESMSCIRSDDTSLLMLVVADRKLKTLGLRLLAPTVAASCLPLSETLAALRKAGYFPVEEDADGSAVVASVVRRRADRRPARDEWRTMVDRAQRDAFAEVATPSAKTTALVRALLEAPDSPHVPGPSTADWDIVPSHHIDAIPQQEALPYEPRWRRSGR
jgi:hypothetical protein